MELLGTSVQCIKTASREGEECYDVELPGSFSILRVDHQKLLSN